MSEIERPKSVNRRNVLKGALAVPVASAAVLVLGEASAHADAPPNDTFDIRTWNAVKNSTAAAATNTAAFVSAMTAVRNNNGRAGTVYVPPGVWYVAAGVVLDTPGATLMGAGMAASTIALGPGVNDQVVKCTVNGVAVERLTIVGQPSAPQDDANHGIRVGPPGAPPSHVDWVRIRDVVIKTVSGYGIGLEKGSFSYVEIDNVEISGCGNDGIDWKNDASFIGSPTDPNHFDPTVSGTRNFMRNITVSNFGSGKGDQTGIDIRGRVGLVNIDSFIPKGVGGQNGVRFRGDSGYVPPNPPGSQQLGEHGLGGHNSTMENFFVQTPVVGAGVSVESGIVVSFGNGTVIGTG